MTAAPPAPRFALDIDGVPRSERAQRLLDAMLERVVIADGAMGTMLQRHELTIEGDFQGLEGCNEILNVTRPDVVAAIHDAYLDVGVDAVETNTFGANWSNLGDYGIEDRITPKFVRRYADLKSASVAAIAAYAGDVRTRAFPGPAESYHLSAEVAETLGLYGRPA